MRNLWTGHVGSPHYSRVGWGGRPGFCCRITRNPTLSWSLLKHCWCWCWSSADAEADAEALLMLELMLKHCWMLMLMPMLKHCWCWCWRSADAEVVLMLYYTSYPACRFQTSRSLRCRGWLSRSRTTRHPSQHIYMSPLQSSVVHIDLKFCLRSNHVIIMGLEAAH